MLGAGPMAALQVNRMGLEALGDEEFICVCWVGRLTLEVLGGLKAEAPVATIYRQTIDRLGLLPTSQGTWAWLYLFLSKLDALESQQPVADTYVNPWRELLHRLEPYKDSYGYQAMAKIIGARIDGDLRYIRF